MNICLVILLILRIDSNRVVYIVECSEMAKTLYDGACEGRHALNLNLITEHRMELIMQQ